MTGLAAGDIGDRSEFRQTSGNGAAANAADFINVNAVGIPIVVLGPDHVIISFNRAAADALSLAPTDIGRSPHAISILNSVQNLETWCAEVTGTDVPTQHDIRIGDKSFILRIAPQTNGTVGGSVMTFTNVTAFRSSIDQAIYEREYTKTILNTVPDPLVVLGTDLRIMTANRAFYNLLRASREAIRGVPFNELYDGALDLPPLTDQLKDLLTDGHAFQTFEIDCDWPEIGRRIISLHACPLVLAGSSNHMALVSFHDITEQKKSEEALRLLAQEVDHRSKNLLALVQATVHFSVAETPEAIKIAIEGRIQALSNVHTLLAKSRWAGADLRTLVRDELNPYCPQSTSRCDIDGTDLTLKPQSAQLIAMVLHELTTNAVKYGALSAPKGRVRVEWSKAANESFLLRWVEVGGPPVKPPTRQGFGTGVLARALSTQLQGKLRFDWRPDGLLCEIEMHARAL
jgi:two-component system CheB/CheR fusion protein